MFTWQVKYSCCSLFAVLFSNSPILVASSSSSEKILCSSTRRHSMISLWTFAEVSSRWTKRTRRRWLCLWLCSFSRRRLHWRNSWKRHRQKVSEWGHFKGISSNQNTFLLPAGPHADEASRPRPFQPLVPDAPPPSLHAFPGYTVQPGQPCGRPVLPSGGPPFRAADHEPHWAASAGPGRWSGPVTAAPQAGRTSGLCTSECGWPPGYWRLVAGKTFQGFRKKNRKSSLIILRVKLRVLIED